MSKVPISERVNLYTITTSTFSYSVIFSKSFCLIVTMYHV